MKKPFLSAIAAAATGITFSVWADNASPVGLWKNIDDQTGKPKALIRITESNGELRGKIEKLFRGPNEDPNPACDKCEGELKGRPIVGMTILSGMRPDGAEYKGGEILDPNNGKVYRGRMQLANGGRQLNVRGYFGIPLLGRSQVWVREE